MSSRHAMIKEDKERESSLHEYRPNTAQQAAAAAQQAAAAAKAATPEKKQDFVERLNSALGATTAEDSAARAAVARASAMSPTERAAYETAKKTGAVWVHTALGHHVTPEDVMEARALLEDTKRPKLSDGGKKSVHEDIKKGEAKKQVLIKDAIIKDAIINNNY